MRRGADWHRGTIIDLQHGETAFVGSIWAETKYAVGAIETGPVGQDVLRITLRALRMGERRGKRYGIVGKCRDAGWIGMIFGAVALREGVEASILGRREPRLLQRRKPENARVVPKTRAEDLHLLTVDPGRGEGLRESLHRIGLFGDEQRIDLIMKRGDLLHRFRHGPRLVMLDAHDPDVVARGRLLEFGFRHAAIVIFRNEGGDRLLAFGRGKIDDPVDVVFDEE